MRLEPSRAEWATAFLEEHSRLSVALSGIDCHIEHIGSTAVPGLPAKPILDIAVGVVDDALVEVAVSAIQELGYEYRGDAAAEGGRILVRESEPLVRTHHVHVVELGGPQWEAYILLRDYLKRSEQAREAYSSEKWALALRYPEDRKVYTAGKDAIVQQLLASARRPTRR